MTVLTVYTHPKPIFCHAILQQLSEGLEAASHSDEMLESAADQQGRCFC